MNVYYQPDGEIVVSLYNTDVFRRTEPEAQVLTVDEIPANKAICSALASTSHWRDSSGLGRWYVINGELFERENWEAATV